MLEEYVRAVPRDALLTEAQRRKMTEENRLAAARREVPPQETALPEPEQTAYEEPVENESERARRHAGHRHAQSERNRRAARQYLSVQAQEPETPDPVKLPEDDGAAAEYEAAAERKRAQERRRQSERNRRAAADWYPPVVHVKRHHVPSDEELIEQLRRRKEEEAIRAEEERILRMQRSAANFRLASGYVGDSTAVYAPVSLTGSARFAYTAGSSAVAVAEEEQEEQDEQAQRGSVQGLPETESLPETANMPGTEEEPRAVQGRRFGVARRSAMYHPKRLNTLRIVLIAVAAVALIGMMIYGKVQTNEIYTEISTLQAQYDDITARNVSMRSEMEGKMTVKNIEEYAENVLGLKPLDQSQIQYIQLQTEDEVTITEPESNWLVTLNDFLSGIKNFFAGR